MPHDWILEVLSDLKRFAAQNGMPLLAAELRAAAEVAALEIANLGPVAVAGGVERGHLSMVAGDDT